MVGPQELTTQVAAAKDPFIGHGSDREEAITGVSKIKEIDTSTYDIATFEESDIQKLYSDEQYRVGNHGVIVEGLVYLPSVDEVPSGLRTGGEPVLLLHFVMVCCAADCVPKVLVLRGVDSGVVQENTWMRVWGVTTHIEGGAMMLDILKIERLAKPTYPYLIP